MLATGLAGEGVAWQTKGEGQFCPLEGSQPFSGDINQLSREDEYKVEMICEEQYIKAVMKALKLSHPYEEPAHGVILLQDF